MMLEITFCKTKVCRNARPLIWPALVAFCLGWLEMDQMSDLQGGWVAKPRGWWSVKRSPATRSQVASFQDQFWGQYYLVSFNWVGVWSQQVYLGNTELLGMLVGRVTVQWDLEKWPDRRSLVGFCEEKCGILRQWWSSPIQQYRILY